MWSELQAAQPYPSHDFPFRFNASPIRRTAGYQLYRSVETDDRSFIRRRDSWPVRVVSEGLYNIKVT